MFVSLPFPSEFGVSCEHQHNGIHDHSNKLQHSMCHSLKTIQKRPDCPSSKHYGHYQTKIDSPFFSFFSLWIPPGSDRDRLEFSHTPVYLGRTNPNFTPVKNLRKKFVPLTKPVRHQIKKRLRGVPRHTLELPRSFQCKFENFSENRASHRA